MLTRQGDDQTRGRQRRRCRSGYAPRSGAEGPIVTQRSEALISPHAVLGVGLAEPVVDRLEGGNDFLHVSLVDREELEMRRAAHVRF